jgi:uncharacterized protein (DUF885 family)
MTRILAGTALAALAFCVHAAEPSWVTRSNESSQVLLRVMAKYAPESAARLGVEGLDEEITDLSRDRFEASQADMREALADLEKRLAAERDPKVRQDLEILSGVARDRMRTAQLTRSHFFPFQDVARQIFYAVQQGTDPRIPPARQQTVLVRLDKYAGIAPGFRPFTELARERTLERIAAAPGLLGPYKGQLESAIAEAPTLRAGIRDALSKSRVKGWEASAAKLDAQLATYTEWLKADILPRARADYRLPPEIYADNLRQFGVDISPDEMISKALTAFAEMRNQANITATLVAKERGWRETDYRAVMRRLKQEQIPKEQVMPLYLERLAAIEAIVRANHIVTLPERKAVIRLATPGEDAALPAPHMNPPRMLGNTGEYGEFVLTQGGPPDPTGKALPLDDFTHQAGAWTLTAHEARPGHELQFAKVIENGVSIARAIFASNSVNTEGWGLYAEAEMQPYEPLDGQLFALQHRMMRAARAFLDPMVNLGQVTPEQVKSFLMAEVVLSEGMATQEMQRYIFRAPGQATSYFYGYQRLMETRQAAQLQLREKFDRQAFNDFILDQGLVPPRLLRQAVMEEFVPRYR